MRVTRRCPSARVSLLARVAPAGPPQLPALVHLRPALANRRPFHLEDPSAGPVHNTRLHPQPANHLHPSSRIGLHLPSRLHHPARNLHRRSLHDHHAPHILQPPLLAGSRTLRSRAPRPWLACVRTTAIGHGLPSALVPAAAGAGSCLFDYRATALQVHKRCMQVFRVEAKPAYTVLQWHGRGMQVSTRQCF